MRRVLFVDDEPRVLEGLQNLLRRKRREWEMVFVTSGHEALAQLAAAPFDVILSDMRMPGMDGSELLKRVQQEYPRTVRIVLSGQTEHDVARRIVHIAHQFLSKPCDGPVLQEVIERSCRLNELLQDDGLRSTVGRLGQLPSVPAVLAELDRVLADTSSSLQDAAAVIERDPAMCAKVLQLVNSAFFGLARRVTAVGTAVSYLGTDVLKGLTVLLEVFDLAGSAERLGGFSIEKANDHALLTARIARVIASGTPMEQDAFVAGMLHDVGELVLVARVPEALAGAMEAARESGRVLSEVEKERIGASHAEIGAYLLGLWGLPLSIVEAVAFHHAPGTVAATGLDLLGIVHVADGLAHEIEGDCRDATGLVHASVDTNYLSSIGALDRLPGWRQAAALLVPSAEERVR